MDVEPTSRYWRDATVLVAANRKKKWRWWYATVSDMLYREGPTMSASYTWGALARIDIRSACQSCTCTFFVPKGTQIGSAALGMSDRKGSGPGRPSSKETSDLTGIELHVGKQVRLGSHHPDHRIAHRWMSCPGGPKRMPRGGHCHCSCCALSLYLWRRLYCRPAGD